jgi:hypothetical protein
MNVSVISQRLSEELSVMAVAALISWLVTALGGFWMLGIWLSRGGMSQQRTGASRFPAPVILGHFLLAAAGLVLWIAFVVVHTKALAWAAFVVLLPVAVLGFVMLLRWLPGWQASRAVAVGAARHGGQASTATSPADAAAPAERHLPVPVILGHGLFAVITLVLVLLAAAGGH